MEGSSHSINLSFAHHSGNEGLSGPTRQLIFGVVVLILAVPVAYAMYRINSALTEQPEKAVQIIAAVFAVLGIVPPAVYIIAQRGSAKLADLSLIIIGTISTFLVACYLFWASFYITFPADFLIWSESDYVNDILKFHIGYPIFTAQVNNESFTYVPGSQLVTYFFAWAGRSAVFGSGLSCSTSRLHTA